MEKQVEETLVDAHPTLVVAESPRYDLWDTVLNQLDDVARRLSLAPGIHAILRQPERELTVSVPVVMDDGLIRVFTGYRVQHFSTREPCQRGIDACGALEVNIAHCTVKACGDQVSLTSTEYTLLRQLALSANRVMLHQDPLTAVRGLEYRDTLTMCEPASTTCDANWKGIPRIPGISSPHKG